MSTEAAERQSDSIQKQLTQDLKRLQIRLEKFEDRYDEVNDESQRTYLISRINYYASAVDTVRASVLAMNQAATQELSGHR
jgi:hypothetical protein